MLLLIGVNKCRHLQRPAAIFTVTFILLCTHIGFAQTFVTTQVGNMDALVTQNIAPLFPNSFAGHFNRSATEYANYANQNNGSITTPGAAAFRTFTTAQTVTGGTARPLRPGDRFVIEASANLPALSGVIGISFKNNSTYTSASDYNNGLVCGFELTAAGFWTIVHNGVTITTAATSGAYRTLQLDIISSNSFNATIAGVTYYNLQFIGAGPVASFCIYNIVTVASLNRSNPDAGWRNASLQGRPIVIGATGATNLTGNLTNGGGENTTALSATDVIFNGSSTIILTPGSGNTYTGSTSITSGNVRLGAANVIPDNAMILNGGTLTTGGVAGFNETIGTLNLSDNSAIALGSGTHTLNFAASDLIGWTAGRTLTITAWNFSAAGRIFFGNSNTGLTAAQLAQINFTGFGNGARILPTGEIMPASIYQTVISGNYNTGATWYGGMVPPDGVSVVIANDVFFDGSNTVLNLTINPGATFNGSDGTPRTLTANSTGGIFNNGTYNATATGTLSFSGSGSLAGSSTITLPSFNFNSGAIITVGTIVSVAQSYTFPAGAAYGFTFNVDNSSFSCPSITTTGANSLNIQRGSSMSVTPPFVIGTLNIGAGSSFSLANSIMAMQVNGNVTMTGNGAFTLGSANGGDLYLTGNWSRGTGVFNPAGRAVFFNGTSIQTVSSATGTETFNFIFVQNSSTLQLMATNITITGVNGLGMSSTAATTIDLNGSTLLVSGGGNMSLSSGTRNINSSLANSVFRISTSTLTVTNAGNLTFGPNVSLELSSGFAINTVNSVNVVFRMQLNAGGFISGITAPVYGTSSSLVYNSGLPYGIGNEWTAGVSSGAGYPNDVQVGILINTSGLSISNSNTYNLRGNLVLAGVTGSNLVMTASTLNIGGNWVNDAPAAANVTMGTGTITFTGTGLNAIGGANSNAGGYAFNNLTVNKTSPGTVTLNRPVTVSNTLTVNGNGSLRLNGFSVSAAALSGTSTSAIINNSHAATIATLTVSNGGGTYAGVLQNGGIAALAFTKSGAGTHTFSGTNTYSGVSTVSGGVLDIASAGAMSATSNYTFNGGNLSVNSALPAAASLSAGTLNIQANTSFNLGTAAATFSINFAASDLVPWNPASTLTVFNWTPSAGKIINVATGTGLTSTQLGKANIDNYGVGSKIVGIEVRPAFLYVTQPAGSGDYTLPASWLLGDRPVLNNGTESIFIQSGFSLNMDVAAPTVNVLRAEVAGTLTMGPADIVNIFMTGDFRVNGVINMNTTSVINLAATTNFQIGGTVNMTSTSVINFTPNITLIATSASANFSSAGTLNFAGAFTITSNTPNTVLLPNVNLTASVDFGQNSTIQNGASLNMLAGGFVNTNSPFYATGSNLVYNTGGNYNRGTEWSSTSGRGYPANVRIGTTTNFQLSNGTPGSARQMSGNLTIDASRTFTLEDGAGMTAALTVLGDVNVNGVLRLGNAIGGDIRIGGNYTVAAAGSIFNNNRAVIFIGTGDQFVTKTGGGTIFFDFIVVNKPSGNVKMTTNTNAHIISQVDNDLSLRVLQLLNGDIDMNGGLITLQGDNINSLNIYVDGSSTRKIFTSTGSGEFRITGTTANGVAKLSVTAGSAGSRLLFDNNVLVTTTVGVNFGVAGITTINAQLRIDQNGYVITNAPDYGPASTLIYNNGAGGYKRNMEWNTNTAGATGAGYPNNVVVQNNTSVDLNSTDFPTTFPLGCSGKMRIAAGSSIITGAMAHTLSVGDTLAVDGILTLSTNAAGDLNVGGGWIRTGTFVQNDRMVTFDSTSNASIRAIGGQSFSRITFNKKTTLSIVTVDSAITVTNELFLQRGAVTLNNDVTLTSGNTRTARIGETTSPASISIAYGAGKFVVQRFLPIANTAAARRWRMLTAPFTSNNAPTINAAWQEGQSSANRLLPSNTVPGFGTAITRSTVAANGYDQGSTNNSSIYGYNSGTNGWEAIAATNAGKITDQPGYMIFVRGDRSIVVSSTSVPGTPTTLRARGEINIGDVSTFLNASGFQVLGNPYASATSFNNVLFNGVSPGSTAGRSFYLWDPKLPGLSNVGGWITCTSLGSGLYSVTANASGYPTDGTFTGVIESGAAFMVPAGGGSFTFREACKIAPSSTVGIASRPGGDNVAISKMDFLTCNLLSGAPGKVVDGVINIGSDDFEQAVNGKDAPKLVSFASTEKISILREQQKLSIELRNKIAAGDTIFYHLAKLVQADYQLAFIGKGINNGLVGFVQDKFTGNSTIINVNDSVYIPFRVTADSASAAADRFRIVFKSSVGYNRVTASAVNSDIVVEWNVSSEFNLLQYEIERSTDGITFFSIGNQLSKGNSAAPVQYNWTDISPAPGKYFYRIKAVNNQAAVMYSNIVKVEIYKTSSSMYVFPNPVTDGTIRLYMNKCPQGIYQVQLYNNIGQPVFSRSLSHTAASATQTITPGIYLAKGMYQLKITAEGQPETILKVVVQ